MRRQPWAGIVKLQEEMAELGVELAKLHARPCGKHWDNSTKAPLIERVKDEVADVQAALTFFAETNFADSERDEMLQRTNAKLAKFREWDAIEGMTGTKDAEGS